MIHEGHPAVQDLIEAGSSRAGATFVLGSLLFFGLECRARHEQPQELRPVELQPDEIIFAHRWSNLQVGTEGLRNRVELAFKRLGFPIEIYGAFPLPEEYAELDDDVVERVFSALNLLLQEGREVYEDPLAIFEIVARQTFPGIFEAPQYLLSVTHLQIIVMMLQPNGVVIDPCFYTGASFFNVSKACGTNENRPELKGQEAGMFSYRFAKTMAVLGGFGDAKLRHTPNGCLLERAFPPTQADFVIARPPLEEAYWGRDQVLNDERWEFGLPPANRADFAYVQHAYSLLNSMGRAAIVLSANSLHSGFEEEVAIRQAMVAKGAIECVISFPPNMYLNDRQTSALWILRGVDVSNSNEVLMVDAWGLQEESGESPVVCIDSERLVGLYRDWINGGSGNVAGLSAVVHPDTLLQSRNCDLRPEYYIEDSGLNADSDLFSQPN